MLIDVIKIPRKNSGYEYEIEFHTSPASQVELISMTENPEKVIAKICGIYEGKIESKPTQDEILTALSNMRKTKLQTPLEMIDTIWLIQNVSRAFTHQIVRYRIGTSFAQESMRFYGQRSKYKILVDKEMVEDYNKYLAFRQASEMAIKSYDQSIESGASSQAARGILPTNIMTSLYAKLSIKTLMNMFTQRMCCQAQPGEWQDVLWNIRIYLKIGSPNIAGFLRSLHELEETCGYNATFDRPCTWVGKSMEEIMTHMYIDPEEEEKEKEKEKEEEEEGEFIHPPFP